MTKIRLLIIGLLITSTNFLFSISGEKVIKSFFIFNARRDDIEKSLLAFLENNQNYFNPDGWQRYSKLVRKNCPESKDTLSIRQFKINKFIIDVYGWRNFIYYENKNHIFYIIKIYNSNWLGCDLSIRNIVFEELGDNIINPPSKEQIKFSLEIFKEQILPKIKSYMQ
jgi:hypothetical protein